MNRNIDLIYFWSSLVLVALPLIVFSVLTYLVTKGYLKRARSAEHGARSREQQP